MKVWPHSVVLSLLSHSCHFACVDKKEHWTFVTMLSRNFIFSVAKGARRFSSVGLVSTTRCGKHNVSCFVFN
jgi:hypothetical protein